MRLSHLIKGIVRPHGKLHFLTRLSSHASILDVGCGNNSPFQVKSILPESTYTGVDVGDYNQTMPNKADRYIITTPAGFTGALREFCEEFDAVLSSHNIEHCDDRMGTLEAMLRATKPGGKIYIAFPCAESVRFPARAGTLNYYDDATHKALPPDFDLLLQVLRESGFQIEHAARHHRPVLFWLLGMLVEPLSRWRKRVMRGTWELYGFESIIIARKHSRSPA
jgi:SAM-dependent methyltransferase